MIGGVVATDQRSATSPVSTCVVPSTGAQAAVFKARVRASLTVAERYIERGRSRNMRGLLGAQRGGAYARSPVSAGKRALAIIKRVE